MARWFAWRADGRQVRFTVAALAHKAGVPKRSTERALERLEADWWIEITVPRVRGSRRPTTYRIVVERLASADPDALHPTASTTARVADDPLDQPPEWRMNEADNRHSGGRRDQWRMKNAPDFDKVADQRSEEEVRTKPSTGTPPASEEVRQRGGRPEHADVPTFLAWARATYPDHASGAHLAIDRDRDGHLVHGLLQMYALERLQCMATHLWTLEADGDPTSHASWIARSDRSLRVLRHKAPFLERLAVGAQQLVLGPIVTFSAQEIAEAKDLRNRVYMRCPHEPRCEDYPTCIREIAYARKIS